MITSYTFLFLFKIVESLQCILKSPKKFKKIKIMYEHAIFICIYGEKKLLMSAELKGCVT